MGEYLFYALATALVLLSLLAVSLPNLLHGAISLIGSFFATAALYIMLQLEFVALAQIMLYIGGIVIFMLIIILLTTDLGIENRHQVPNRRRLAGAGVSGMLLFGLLYAIGDKPSMGLIEGVQRALPVTMDDIGLRLLSTSKDGFIVPFEIISILLLVDLVGALFIARRDSIVVSAHDDIQEENG
jgi:NADH-quinone oxidoreductase subunit J